MTCWLHRPVMFAATFQTTRPYSAVFVGSTRDDMTLVAAVETLTLRASGATQGN